LQDTMDNAGFLSRPVTLRIIKKLLDNHIILNASKKPMLRVV